MKTLNLIGLTIIVLLIESGNSIPYRLKSNKPIHQDEHAQSTITQNNNSSNFKSTALNSTILWPLPKSLQYNSSAQPLMISPCAIQYKISSPSNDQIMEMINLYLIQVFKCTGREDKINITLFVNVVLIDQMIALNTSQQKYTLIIRQSNRWQLNADYYVGFLRGLQTFSQLFQLRVNQKQQTYFVINNIPIVIDDQPDFLWRGLMIDSSRHYLPLNTIKKLIDGIMYNKMNILHWHIIDEDSFPMDIPTVPELSQYGSVGGTYSTQDIKQLIQYAKTRGIRLIPQIDTPAHTQSWGRSEKYKDIIVNCNTEYDGQFDPTLNLTYEVVQKVMEYVNNAFVDNYVHMGGDQTEEDCWDLKPEIKEKMKQLNISDYVQLQIYYRQQQKKIWRKITPTKKAIYWANQQIDLPLESDDILQWWGDSENISNLIGRKNDIILSNYDLAYLDVGYGDNNGDTYKTYESWRTIYEKFNGKIQGVNVIGAEVCIWAETTNQHNIEAKVWIRSSAMAQKLWNSEINPKNQLTNVATRLYAHSQRMRGRGYKVSPVSVGLCEKDMSICFI